MFVPFILTTVVNGTHYPPKEGDVSLAMAHFFNASATAAILNEYPETQFHNESMRLAIILRDYFFLCASRLVLLEKFLLFPKRLKLLFLVSNVAQVMSAAGRPVYLYQFVYDRKGWVDYDILGDYHTFDLSFVFENQWPGFLHYFDDRDKTMAGTFGLFFTRITYL